jgi:hypothetical protein
MAETGLDRPILVIGAPRSGKSLVTNVFFAADEFCVLGEALMTWNLGMRSRPDDRRLADEASDKVREQIVEALLSQIRSRDGDKTRYLDNLAYNALRVPFLHAVLPEAKLILVVRDPRSVIPEMHYAWTAKASMRTAVQRTRTGVQWRSVPRLAARFAVNYVSSRLRKRRSTWGPVVPGLREFAATHSVAETAAYQWLRLNEIALLDLDRLPADRWLLVRFEDLLSDVEGSFRRIADFAEVQDPEKVVAYAGSYIDASNVPEFAVSGFADPSDDEWRSIRAMVDPLRERLGYST